MISHVLELCHQLVTQLVINDRHLKRRRLIGQKVSIVSALEMKFQIWGKRKEFSLKYVQPSKLILRSQIMQLFNYLRLHTAEQ